MNTGNGTVSLPLQLLIGLALPDAMASPQEMAVARTISLPPPAVTTMAGILLSYHFP